MANEVRIEARPWEPQDLIDDLQLMIDEEPDNYLNANRATLCMARDYLKKFFAEESPRPKGRWEIHCRSTYDSWTQETDEEFYLECSECKRQVWDVDYMAVQNDDRQKLIEKYPYCHCGCKMEG